MTDVSFWLDVFAAHPFGSVVWLAGSGVACGSLGVALAKRRDAARFRAISEVLDEGVVVHEQGRPVEFNDTLLRMTGYAREEFSRLNLVDSIVHPESRVAVVARIREDGESPYPVLGLRKDGTTFRAEVRPKVLSTVFGRKRLVVVRDLTSLHAAEVARRECEERCRSIVESVADPMVFHREGVVQDVNPAFTELFGYTLAELKGRDLVETLVVSEDRALVRRRLASKERRTCEARARRHDGKSVDIELLPRGVTAPGGAGEMLVLRDITLRKRAEERLARQVSLHQSMLEAIGEGVLVVDSTGRIVSSNARFGELWKAPQELLLSGDDATLLAHVTRQVRNPDAFLARVRELYANPTEESDDIVALRDGRIFERHSRPQVLYGVPVGRVWSFRDVTGLESAREALRMQVARLDATLEAASEGILVVDTQGRAVAHNGRLASLWSLAPDFFQGRPVRLADVERADLVGERVDGDATNGGTLTTLRLRDGRIFERTKHAYRTEGEESGTVYSYRDISHNARETERLRSFGAELEERVRERTAELERANLTLRGSNAELEAFSFSVSHDLRSPLRGVDGLSLALSEEYADKLDDTGREYVRRIRSGVQRMGRIMDDLIHLSRVNRTELNLETVDLSALARGVVATLRQDQSQRTVIVDVAEGATAYGDRRLLRVMLENLLGNAWKYSSKKSAAVIVFGFRDLVPGRREFFVRDNGAGFDPAYRDKLFSTFTRLHGPNEFEGSGLGLAIVGRIVKRHNGSITADAQVGKGATFTFVLPTAPADASA